MNTLKCMCVHISSKMTNIMFFQFLYFSFMFYIDIGIKHILSALLFPHTGYFLFTFSPGSIFLKLFSYKYIQNNNLKGEYFKYIMDFFPSILYIGFFCCCCSVSLIIFIYLIIFLVYPFFSTHQAL